MPNPRKTRARPPKLPKDLYLDQGGTDETMLFGDRLRRVVAAYTPHGIHRMDSLYIRRIRAGHGSKRKLRAEIAANPHLHRLIKENLIENLDRLFDRYKRNPFATYIPPGSVVMIKDCEYDRDLRPRYINDHVRGPYQGDMLSHHAGDIGYVEWYQDSGDLSVCLRSGHVGRDGYIEEGRGEYFAHDRATFRHDELEVLWESPWHQS